MIRTVLPDKRACGEAAAEEAANLIREAILKRGKARICASTGASQFDFLGCLVSAPGIDWKRVELFHLDEYIGISKDHPASFQRYIQERIIDATGITCAHLLNGMVDPSETARVAGEAVAEAPIDVAFVGIGENGHLAFNDPPADFDADEPYIVVNLDERCRLQQVNEGWFATLDDVPLQAISMSIRQILKARAILAIVPEKRKAEAVKRCFEGEINPLAPASALRLHPNVAAFLDRDSASLLEAAR